MESAGAGAVEWWARCRVQLVWWCLRSDALVIIASVRGGWKCPGKPGGLEDERERRGKRKRRAKVGGGRFIGNLGGPELLADLERVQLWDGAGVRRCRCRCRRRRTALPAPNPHLHLHFYTGHFPVSDGRRATGSRPTKVSNLPKVPGANSEGQKARPGKARQGRQRGVGTDWTATLPSPSSSKRRASYRLCFPPQSSQAAHAWALTEVIHSLAPSLCPAA